MSVDRGGWQSPVYIPNNPPNPVTWDWPNHRFIPAPGGGAPGSITTPMLAPNAVTASHQVLGAASNPTTTSTTPVQMPDMTVTFTAPGEFDLLLSFSGSFSPAAAAAQGAVVFSIDGGEIFSQFIPQVAAAALTSLGYTVVIPGMAAGPHTVAMLWNVNAGNTLTNVGTLRTLTAVELRR